MANTHTSQSDPFDLDEDLFNFEEPLVEEFAEDEEDLEAIFAAFQTKEDARAEADARAVPGAPEGSANYSASPEFEGSAENLPDSIASSTMAEGRGRATVDTGFREAAFQPAGAASTAMGRTAPRFGRVAGTVSKSTLLILVSVTLVNGLAAFVSLRNTATIRDTVMHAERRMAQAAGQLRDEAFDRAREIVELRQPLVPPNTEDHPTFTRAADLIREGEFGEARARIYALLAIVDRLEETQRDEVEARAQFLLAEASHLEALTRYGEEQR